MATIVHINLRSFETSKNVFIYNATVRIFIAFVSLLWLIVCWSIPGTAFAQGNNVVMSDDIPVLSDSEAEEVNRLQEAIWAIQWFYLPKSLEQVEALYGYSLSDIENSDDHSLQIYDPILIYDTEASEGSYPNTLKLKLHVPDSGVERKFDLTSIVNKKNEVIQEKNQIQPELQNSKWFLATDTFIPGIEPTCRFVVSTP